ncbi:MAG TPA: glycosyl hydrolase family 28 protein, partial [Tepidisphaeraceae bacterium]|nr:glycosyl hydrolase family 28 protein [Tepidisphaeraceae bacterium]
MALSQMVGSLSADAQVVLYPTPPTTGGVQASSVHDVKINGQSAFVYGVSVNNTNQYQDLPSPASMLPFGLHGGSATVEVTLKNGTANSAMIRAQSRNITPTINGNTVSFTVSEPGNYSIEINGRTQPLFLFANPAETNAPTGPSANVIYFGPGVHNAGQITVGSNQTVYLAPGAFVNGYISSTNANNVTIRGRGVLHGGSYTQGQIGQKFIHLRNGNGALVEGIIALNSPEWNLNPDNQRNVTIDNFKTIGHRRNSDSIDPVNANGLTIRNSFLKGHDDGITLKGRAGGAYDNNSNIRNVLVENTTIWNQRMRPIVVGGELNGIQNVENLRFRNIDIIYSGHNPMSGMTAGVNHPFNERNRDAAMSVWNVDNADVKDVIFEDNRVEHADRLVRLSILQNQFSGSGNQRGTVSDVTFRNVTSGAGANVLDITGHSRNHQVRDVTFENLRIGGQLISGPDEVRYVTNAHARNVRFVTPTTEKTVIFADAFDPFDASETFADRYNVSTGRTGTLALLNDGSGLPRNGVATPLADGSISSDRGRWDAGGNSNFAGRTFNETIGSFEDYQRFQVSAHFIYVDGNNTNVNLAGVGVSSSSAGVQ